MPDTSSAHLHKPATTAASSDGGAVVVAVLNDRWRVIVCQDGIQWVLQRRAGERGGRARWMSEGYFRSRDALIAFSHARARNVAPAASDRLASLPPRFTFPGGVHAAS